VLDDTTSLEVQLSKTKNKQKKTSKMQKKDKATGYNWQSVVPQPSQMASGTKPKASQPVRLSRK
jgi:hypothetical protein